MEHLSDGVTNFYLNKETRSSLEVAMEFWNSQGLFFKKAIEQ